MTTESPKVNFWQTENFKRRTLSSVAIVVIALAAILGGVVPFGLLLSLLIMVGLWEWRKMSGDHSYDFVTVFIVAGLIFGLASYLFTQHNYLPAIYSILTVGCLVNIIVVKTYALLLKKPSQRYYYLCGVIPLTAFGYVHLQLGGWNSLALLSIIWITDTFAYLTGKRFGKRKLCPTISAGKTIEGAVGGFLIALIYGLVIGYKTDLSAAFTIPYAIILPVFIILVQLGDLLESIIKRKYRVKDSSNLIPGHGGVLDRIDSFILTMPFIMLLLML